LARMLSKVNQARSKDDMQIQELHPRPHTILRVAEKPINPEIFGLNDPSKDIHKAKRIKRIYTMMKQCMPVFSGATSDYEINYLLELDLLKRLT